MWIALIVCLLLLTVNVVIGVYVERKLSAFMQDRLGPMEVGKWGLLQVFADLLKLFQKEDIVPENAQKRLFLFAPWIIFLSVFGAFAVIPLSSGTFLQYIKVIIPKGSHRRLIEPQSELRLIRNTYYSKSIPLIKFPNYLRKQSPLKALSPSLFGCLARKYLNSKG